MSERFPPVGKCIYCGSPESLSDEHIIPYGLDGDRILPKSSCHACAAVTSKVERHCQREMLGFFRQTIGFQSRRKKIRPEKLPLEVTYEDGRVRTLMLLPANYPKSLCLPVMPIARALRGLLPDLDEVPVRGAGWWMWYDQEARERLGAQGVVSYEGSGTINPSEFLRMIAKIAYGAAVANWGVNTFEPLITDFILGRAQGMNYLVGCVGREESIKTAFDHTVNFREHRPSGMLIVNVRLFAALGAPTYHALVGLRAGGRIMKIFDSPAGSPVTYPLPEQPDEAPFRIRDVTDE